MSIDTILIRLGKYFSLEDYYKAHKICEEAIDTPFPKAREVVMGVDKKC